MPATAPTAQEWFREASSHRDPARQSLARIDRDAGLGDSVGRAADDFRDSAADRTAVAKEFASDLAASFRHGLEDLSDTARKRIATTREQAYGAVIAAKKRAQAVSKSTGRLIDDQPVILGLVAAAETITACHAAFAGWRKLTPEAPGKTLVKIGQGLRDNADALAQLMSRNVGKLLSQSHQEIELCAGICDWTAAQGPDHLKDETREMVARAGLSMRRWG